MDVSKASKVSITTVSRVINGLSKKYRISAKTEKLVIKAARSLNYRPNLAAVNFRLSKSNTIGLLVPSLANPFFANISSFIATELHNEGYSVMICDCGEDENIEVEMVNLLVDRRIDGLLVSPSATRAKHLEKVYKRGLPVVCFDRYFKNSVIPYVSTDNYQGAYDIACYLIRAGHKNIACIQATLDVMPVVERLRGFNDAMKESGLKLKIAGNNFSIQNGYDATKKLLKGTKRPTAIFTFTENIALGCLKALREEGLDIPSDVSLITFDDAEYLNFLDPPVTAVVQDVKQIALMSVKILLERIASGTTVKNQHKILFVPKFIYRSSVRNL